MFYWRGKIERMSQPTRKLDQLTITRFIAALSVVLFHGGHQLEIVRYFPMLTAGPTAVGYFFVLSGFVMALAYYRPGAPLDFRIYWLARFSRIYPVYILAFALTCLHYLSLLSKIKPPKVLASVFLYQAWVPDFALSFNIAAWSLSVEVFFYLVLPFLLLWAVRRSVRQVIWVSVGFWIISQFVHVFLMTRLGPDSGNFLAYFPLFHLNAFVLGLAGGIWYLTYSSRVQVRPTLNLLCLFMAWGAVLLLLSLRAYLPIFPRSFSLDVGLLAPLFLVIVLTLALDKSRLSQGLSHPWLILLGDASYALYILHVPVRWLFQDILALAGQVMEFGVMFSIYLPILILLCIFVFQYIERPTRNWLRTNPHMLTKILLDILLIFAMIRFSFILRLGTETSAYLRTETFALRVGIVVFFLALFLFQYYTAPSWRSLTLATLSGAAALSGFMYVAWTSSWVEGFPRSILLLIPLLVFTAIYSSRLLMEFLKPKVQVESKLS
jgi:peptidoglycan/LPS O-acetylase OafA/YrhL